MRVTRSHDASHLSRSRVSPLAFLPDEITKAACHRNRRPTPDLSRKLPAVVAYFSPLFPCRPHVRVFSRLSRGSRRDVHRAFLQRNRILSAPRQRRSGTCLANGPSAPAAQVFPRTFASGLPDWNRGYSGEVRRSKSYADNGVARNFSSDVNPRLR